jgi:pimeloyl-ACP methyl ester carboxylesterase
MPHTTIRGISAHYLTEGRGADVVMIHGFLENLAAWHLGLAPMLRDEFRVTTYDLRGHGHSDMTPRGYTPAELAADLLALMDALGVAQASLVGRSFGADVALHFCARHPDRVRRLIAIEPALVGGLAHAGDQSWGGWDYWGAQLDELGFPVPADKRWDLQFLFEATAQTSAVDGPFGQVPRSRERLVRLIRETALLSECGDVLDLTRDAVQRIETPTLLIYGAQSPFLTSMEFLRSALPHCRPILVSGAGHLKPWERTTDLWSEMREFLHDDVDAASTSSHGRSELVVE